MNSLDQYLRDESLSRQHRDHHARFTSIKNYHEYVVKELMGDRQELVYNAVVELNQRGVNPSDTEITHHLGFKDPNTVRPRRYELVKLGAIVEAGKKYCSFTHKLVLSWKAPRLEQLFHVVDEDTLQQYKYLPRKKWDALRQVLQEDGYEYEGNCIWRKRK